LLDRLEGTLLYVPFAWPIKMNVKTRKNSFFHGIIFNPYKLEGLKCVRDQNEVNLLTRRVIVSAFS